MKSFHTICLSIFAVTGCAVSAAPNLAADGSESAGKVDLLNVRSGQVVAYVSHLADPDACAEVEQCQALVDDLASRPAADLRIDQSRPSDAGPKGEGQCPGMMAQLYDEYAQYQGAATQLWSDNLAGALDVADEQATALAGSVVAAMREIEQVACEHRSTARPLLGDSDECAGLSRESRPHLPCRGHPNMVLPANRHPVAVRAICLHRSLVGVR